jgi:hypothetical protein
MSAGTANFLNIMKRQIKEGAILADARLCFVMDVQCAWPRTVGAPLCISKLNAIQSRFQKVKYI